jgi:hypothetical protein
MARTIFSILRLQSDLMRVTTSKFIFPLTFLCKQLYCSFFLVVSITFFCDSLIWCNLRMHVSDVFNWPLVLTSEHWKSTKINLLATLDFLYTKRVWLVIGPVFYFIFIEAYQSED